MCFFLLTPRPAEFLRVGAGNLIFKEESQMMCLLTKPELFLQRSTVVHVSLRDKSGFSKLHLLGDVDRGSLKHRSGGGKQGPAVKHTLGDVGDTALNGCLHSGTWQSIWRVLCTTHLKLRTSRQRSCRWTPWAQCVSLQFWCRVGGEALHENTGPYVWGLYFCRDQPTLHLLNSHTWQPRA